MIAQEAIRQFTDTLARVYKPQRIILFGSYAYGTPTPDSDVDILVILPYEGRSFRKAAEILTRLHPSFPVDLLVRTPEESQKRIAWGDSFLKEIIAKGHPVYESSDSGVDFKSGLAP